MQFRVIFVSARLIGLTAEHQINIVSDLFSSWKLRPVRHFTGPKTTSMKSVILMPRRRTNLRILILLSVLFFLICFAPVSALVSDTEGPTVDGSFEIVSSEGPTRHIEFHAVRGLDGSVDGATTFRDEPIGVSQPHNEAASDRSQPFFFKADFDCLAINQNRAIMSGEIKQASSQEYVGRRVLVVAQDNGGTSDPSKTDRLTWGIYHSDQKTWFQSDSERSAEQIGPLSWIATDSERLDDEGVLANNESMIGCQSFPLSAFSFVSAKLGHGSVRVKP